MQACTALISSALQVKLLRVLQEQEFERVGDTRTINVDCRVVAASNQDLMDAIEEGTFREDLYYRLNVVEIQLPPLRERRDDIPALVRHFAAGYGNATARKPLSVSPDICAVMQAYDWPGNVRELQNCVERAVVLATSDTIEIDLLPAPVRGSAPGRPS